MAKDTFDLSNINSTRPIVREILKYKNGGSALDLGCSVGRHSLFLAKKGFKVTAVDNRTEVLAALKELTRLQKLNIRIESKNLETYVPSKKFDVILSNHTLHFLPAKLHKSQIEIMQHHTKKDGLNAVSVYTDKNPKGTRPFLIKTGLLKSMYEKAGWKIISHEESLVDKKMKSGEQIKYFYEEILAQKS